jgi:hypothetical protein
VSYRVEHARSSSQGGELLDTSGSVLPHDEHTEPSAVKEFEGRISLGELGPETIHSEPGSEDVRVVEQDDPPIRELRLPRLEVRPDRLVGVEAVDMEQVDGSLAEA